MEMFKEMRVKYSDDSQTLSVLNDLKGLMFSGASTDLLQ
jgi:hypothetical protein